MSASGSSLQDRPIDLVVFDLGGVLVQIVRSWAEAHERAGLPRHAILEDLAFHRARTRLAHEHQIGAITPDQWASGIAAASRSAYSADDAMRVLLAWHWGEYPGVRSVVDAIEAAGVQTGALSNTNAAHWRELRADPAEVRFPTVRRLQHAQASHLLRLAKPDPAIFRAYEQRTGFGASRIAFFDDIEENVTAARAAGWRAIRIDHRGDTAEQLHEHLRRLQISD
jgi:HAD superfamily hydrolase (TIGR01509 family)